MGMEKLWLPQHKAQEALKPGRQIFIFVLFIVKLLYNGDFPHFKPPLFYFQLNLLSAFSGEVQGLKFLFFCHRDSEDTELRFLFKLLQSQHLPDTKSSKNIAAGDTSPRYASLLGDHVSQLV